MPEHTKKRKHPVGNALSRLTGFPVEGLCNMPVFLCKGRAEVAVEGCRSILEYSDTRIRLHMGDDVLTVQGEGLSMSDFHRDALTIRGHIRGTIWEDRDA